MKRIVLSLVLAFAFVVLCAMPVAAEDSPYAPLYDIGADGSKIVSLEDGGRLIFSPPTALETNGVYALASSKTVSYSKDVTYESSDGDIEWVYTLVGVFSYESGVSSKCIDASYTQTIHKGNWKFSNGSATVQGASAKGGGKYVKKILFVTVHNYEIDISLTCDIYGNVT